MSIMLFLEIFWNSIRILKSRAKIQNSSKSVKFKKKKYIYMFIISLLNIMKNLKMLRVK